MARISGDHRTSIVIATTLLLYSTSLTALAQSNTGARAPATESNIATAAKGLNWKSERDARIVYLESAAPVPGPMTAESVRTALMAVHNRLTSDGTVWPSPTSDYAKLAKRTPEMIDFEPFFANLTSPADPNDSGSVALAAKFAALGDSLKAKLIDLHVIRFNESPDTSDPITTSIFIVGKTADGKIAGVLTCAIGS